ncbi:MAG: hypothetical protein NZ556_09615 [Fimbriimonadales bacterium]|nr:hypothetical protein [Fimbriimonadales bacterium]
MHTEIIPIGSADALVSSARRRRYGETPTLRWDADAMQNTPVAWATRRRIASSETLRFWTPFGAVSLR